jgi:DNA-binding NtrC family response regulator
MLLEDIEKGELDLKMALEELREIENDARRCRKITRKLLDFSRRMPEERRNLDLTRVIEDALILVQRQAEIENISFHKKYAEELPQVWGNSNSFQQVIINLVKNAMQRAVVMAENGVISIKDVFPSQTGEDPALFNPSDPLHQDLSFQDMRRQVVRDFTRQYLTRTLIFHNGNITNAAKAMGIRRTSLQRLIRQSGLSSRQFKGLGNK